jgi:hypothetical protein
LHGRPWQSHIQDGCAERRWNQRLIALHIDHDGVIRPSTLFNYFGDAIGTAGVASFGQACFKTVLTHHIGNRVMIGGDPDLLRAAQGCLFGNPHYHRFTGNQQQRLAG